MKLSCCQLIRGLLFCVGLEASAAVHFVNVANPTPASPYSDWTSAATNIQDAVDVATDGDEVVVTNGVYCTGGRVAAGALTNRVAITNALTLRSVNGPAVTIIQGYQVPGTTNGDGAVRCVCLANGANLTGFALINGGTRTAGSNQLDRSGGGAWCGSQGTLVSNCMMKGNSAAYAGAGGFSGTLIECLLSDNSAPTGGGVYCGILTNCNLINNSADDGGGAYGSTLAGCLITGNSARWCGGGAYYGALNNCSLSGNTGALGGAACLAGLANCALQGNLASSNGGGAFRATLTNCTLTGNRALISGGGAIGGQLFNCILYSNSAPSWANYSTNFAGTLSYCCTTPTQDGQGNLAVDPLLVDSFHLSSNSPCIGAGNAAYAIGVDIDGEPWANPPSIGCDELGPGSRIGDLSVNPQSSYTIVPPGLSVDFVANITGRVTSSIWNFGDGTVVSNQPYTSHAWTTVGDYSVVLTAYNDSYPGGVSATLLMHITNHLVHYVALANTSPVSPYTSWETAATNIQNAIDVASAGDEVVVTNGVFSVGSTYAAGSNRVAVTKPVTVRSVNGPRVTTISGRQWDGSGWPPSEPSRSVRCVYLTNGAALVGFTLTNGGTPSFGGATNASGAGVWSASLNTVISNCVMVGNIAYGYGGGAYSGTLVNCTVTSNTANYGGGACSNMLVNCTLTGNCASYGGGADASCLSNCELSGNWATNEGGGVLASTLANCNLTDNSAWWIGGGASQSVINNSILFDNHSATGSNYYSCSLAYCCTMPYANGAGNLAVDPQLASTSHLCGTSPCLGAGSALYTSGTDIDGEPWSNPPAIGCDELDANARTGPLSVAIRPSYTNLAAGFELQFAAVVAGSVRDSVWDFGDGTRVTNRAYASHAWSTPGDYTVVLTADNDDYPSGVSTSLPVHAGGPVLYVALASQTPVPPYDSWATAATNIQAAVDAAPVGALVLVSNGVYGVGSRLLSRYTANRVAISMPLTLRSFSGPSKTSINGSNIFRCVYLAHGAAIEGFTLTNGAAPASPYAPQESLGGGVYCESLTPIVSNCVISGNVAYFSGGGACYGTLTNCALASNSVSASTGYGSYGGGTYYSLLNNCTLIANSAPAGGGAWGGTLNNCELTGNKAAQKGGGAASNVLNNCTLAFNSAGSLGGGTYGGTLSGCTLISNSVPSGAGGGADESALNDCVLIGNSALYGGGANWGTLTNCALTNNWASCGGGTSSNTLDTCVLAGNSSSSFGGGAYYGILTNCTLRGNLNSGYYGGGAAYSTLNNCTLTANSAYFGGGAYFGALKNCILTGNSGYSGGGACHANLTGCALSANLATTGGGVIDGNLTNCTLTGNSALSGGGAAGANLENCILFYNLSPTGSNYYVGSLNYCCAMPAASGEGNLATDPQLATPWHLSPGSPCVGAGSAGYATGVDIDGEPWANPPSIGCDEYVAGGVTGPLSVAIQGDYASGKSGLSLVFGATITGKATASVWDFGDGTLVTNVPYLPHTWANGGNYTVVLTAYSDAYPAGVSASLPVYLSAQKRRFVVSANTSPVAPYTTWATAATNIQDAVDAAVAGEEVIVTNGLYSAGGRATSGASGTLSNRVAIWKPMTVRSLNGPLATIIQGYQMPGSTNGNNAIRGVYLTNGAVLVGFTVTNGATKNSGSSYPDMSGGGVLSISPNTLVSNCIITGNSAYYYGGGVFSNTLVNCTLTGNSARDSGGGAYLAGMANCALSGNSAGSGGGVCSANLTNCTLTGNSANSGGGAYNSVLRNCILSYNSGFGSNYYYSGSSFSFCCTMPPAAGTGNIALDPQLAKPFHLSATSPCRGAGSASYATGADLDGDPWANPPSIGCDEYNSGARTGDLNVAIQADYVNGKNGLSLALAANIAGNVSATVWDFGDGTLVTNLPTLSHSWVNPGSYTVVLTAYNDTYPGGVSAALPLDLSSTRRRYVAAANTSPGSPYIAWATAATNIQDAVDAASTGEEILVTNGVYGASGRVVSGSMTNRVALTKVLTVRSLNGPLSTIIQGFQVPIVTNGDAAVRCVYLTNGAVLAGFTLTNGATRDSGDTYQEMSGGGAWGASVTALVSNCVITGNSAYCYGGGACYPTLVNCRLSGNSAQVGGGASRGTAINCTISGNSAISRAGGTYYGSLLNSIVYNNTAPSESNYYNSTLTNCCTFPLPTSGVGNFTNNPLFVDQASGNFRLQPTSPCINAGANAFALGATDLEGNPRVVGGTVDIGAYEYQTPEKVPFYTWLQQHGIPTDGSADDTDSDGDGLSNWQEWIAGTDPNNPASTLRMLQASNTTSGICVSWASVSSRLYSLERATNLAGSPAFSLLRSNLPGLDGATAVTDTNAAGPGPFFYRVRVQP